MVWGVCSIQVRLNSPIDRVNTISAPARMPGTPLGIAMWKKRCQKPAPRLAAPSSNSFRLIEVMIAITERTMNGRVKMTWPTRMKSQLRRNPVNPP